MKKDTTKKPGGATTGPQNRPPGLIFRGTGGARRAGGCAGSFPGGKRPKTEPELHKKKHEFEFEIEFEARFSRKFRPKPTPGTPLDRRGPPRTSSCTKNQPRRPILRPFSRHPQQKSSQTAFRYPVFQQTVDLAGFGDPASPGTLPNVLWLRRGAFGKFRWDRRGRTDLKAARSGFTFLSWHRAVDFCSI